MQPSVCPYGQSLAHLVFVADAATAAAPPELASPASLHQACQAVMFTTYGSVVLSVCCYRFTSKPQLHASCHRSAGALPWFAACACCRLSLHMGTAQALAQPGTFSLSGRICSAGFGICCCCASCLSCCDVDRIRWCVLFCFQLSLHQQAAIACALPAISRGTPLVCCLCTTAPLLGAHCQPGTLVLP